MLTPNHFKRGRNLQDKCCDYKKMMQDLALMVQLKSNVYSSRNSVKNTSIAYKRDIFIKKQDPKTNVEQILVTLF